MKNSFSGRKLTSVHENKDIKGLTPRFKIIIKNINSYFVYSNWHV